MARMIRPGRGGPRDSGSDSPRPVTRATESESNPPAPDTPGPAGPGAAAGPWQEPGPNGNR
eukprot:151680-Hanusia_phi.AAC.1